MVESAKFRDVINAYPEIFGNMTYKQIAEQVIGCSENAVYYWMNKQRVPSGSVLKCLEWYINLKLLQQQTDETIKRIHDYYQR
jgi:ribosome-binding protein aMBF1 (putative translation factor)